MGSDYEMQRVGAEMMWIGKGELYRLELQNRFRKLRKRKVGTIRAASDRNRTPPAEQTGLLMMSHESHGVPVSVHGSTQR